MDFNLCKVIPFYWFRLAKVYHEKKKKYDEQKNERKHMNYSIVSTYFICILEQRKGMKIAYKFGSFSFVVLHNLWLFHKILF